LARTQSAIAAAALAAHAPACLKPFFRMFMVPKVCALAYGRKKSITITFPSNAPWMQHIAPGNPVINVKEIS